MIVFQLAALPLVAVLLIFVCIPRWRRGRLGTAAWLRPAFAAAVLCVWVNACGWLQPLYNRILDTHGFTCMPGSTGHALAPFARGSHPVFIVLGGGTDFTGPHRTLRPKGDSIEKIAMAGACYARAKADGAHPRVIVTGGNPQRHPMAEGDVYAPDLLSLGISAADLSVENRSWNTYQNAEFVAPMVRKADPDALYLITTALHMHRSLLNFARFDMSPTPITPPWHATRMTLWPSLDSLALSATALHEIIGTVVFHLYRAIGKY